MPGETDHEARFKAIAALEAGATLTAAAKAAGLTRSALYQAAKSDERLAAAMSKRVTARQAPGETPAVSPAVAPVDDDPDERLALRTLRKIVRDDETPAGARVMAARELRAAAAERRKHLAPPAAATPAAPVDDQAQRQAAALADARAFLARRPADDEATIIKLLSS